MIELTAMFYAFAIPAVIFAGISKGGFGSGAAFASTPFLALVLEPAQAVALMLPLLMVMDATALRAWWGRWNRHAATVLIAGGAVGTAIGAAVFAAVPAWALKLMIGAIALGFVIWRTGIEPLLTRRAGSGPQTLRGLFWGTVAGVTSFVSHAGGPPATIYLLGRDLRKEQYQATAVLVFAVVNLMKAGVYAGMGLFGGATLLAILTLAPAAALGTVIGVWAHHRLSERIYYALIYVFLTLTGAKLIWDALA